jgi:hypothetical protein
MDLSGAGIRQQYYRHSGTNKLLSYAAAQGRIAEKGRNMLPRRAANHQVILTFVIPD